MAQNLRWLTVAKCGEVPQNFGAQAPKLLSALFGTDKRLDGREPASDPVRRPSNSPPGTRHTARHGTCVGQLGRV
jgi:hypothetical protein